MEILEQSKIIHLDEKALVNSFPVLVAAAAGYCVDTDCRQNMTHLHINEVKRYFTMLWISATCMIVRE